MTHPLQPADRPTDRLAQPHTPTSIDAAFPPSTVGAPTAPRPAARRVARLRSQLGERDLAVLTTLAVLRLATGDQLQRIHIFDGSPSTRARRTRAMLQRLSDLKLVVRLGRSVGGVHAGSRGFVYGLSGHGLAVLALNGGFDGRRRRVYDTSPSHEDHLLAVGEMYVTLIEAERAEQLELLDFEAEPPCWRRFPGPQGQTIILKPDAFVRIAVNDVEVLTFVEVDLGTESRTTLTGKCSVYDQYCRTGVEQQRNDVFPGVLWLGRDARSSDRLVSVIERLPQGSQSLFRVALLQDAVLALISTAQGGRVA